MVSRIDWIDALKGFAILTVVIGHCVTDSLASHTFPEYLNLLQLLYDAIYSFHMPLFFAISGYVFYLTKSYNKWKIKALDFIIIYVIWSSLMWLSKYIMGGDVNHPVTVVNLLEIVYKPIMIYWYLYVLIVLYILVSCLKWEKVSWSLLGGTAAIAVMIKILQLDIGILNNTIYHMYYFLMGGVLQQSNLLPKLRAKHMIILGSLVLMNSIAHFIWIPASPIIVAIKTFLVANCISLICFWIFSKIKVMEAFRIMGINTLQIYVMHCFFTGGIRVLFKHMHLSNIGLYFLSATFLGIVIPILFAKLCKRVPLLNVVFEPKIRKWLRNG